MSSETPALAAVILAAGKGTRMKSAYAKALFPLCGQPMVTYPVRAARQAGVEQVIVVVGYQADTVRNAVGDSATYALQHPQHGTGHALLCAEEALHGFIGTLFVHCVDVPLLPAALIEMLVHTHQAQGNAATLLTAKLPDAGNYGRIVRDAEGNVRRIVEARDASPQELALNEYNSGIYCFAAPLVFEALREVTPNNDQGEYYLTDVVERLLARGKTVGAVVAPNVDDVAGINDRVQLAAAEGRLRQVIRERHLRNGVTLLDPASTFIDEDVEIGRDTVIHPFSLLYAGTRIGENCTIGPSCQLFSAIIEDDVEVISSRVEHSIVHRGARIGPFSRLRAGCEIDGGASIGNFSELKNTHVGANSAVHHVGYLGDATLGAGVNIGAGTITCNFDGKNKHWTEIGDRAFIGSNTIIIAPRTIGDDALTGAGSVVTHDIPAGVVAYGVPVRVVRKRKG